MEYLHAIILGIVQGIAEFLPISSSGHLVLADALLRQFCEQSVPKESATMGIALHFGTLMSILVIYRKELSAAIKDWSLLFKIVVATIPVAIIGIALNDHIERVFSTPLLVGCALLLTAVFLVTAGKLQRADSHQDSIDLKTAVVIGLFQAIAVVPGVSRSGSTIAAGLLRGLNREDAAKFSFLIAIPAIGGASAVQLLKILSGREDFSGDPGALAAGMVTAFVVGVLSLNWLLKMIVKDRLNVFACYCAAVGVGTIIWQLAV